MVSSLETWRAGCRTSKEINKSAKLKGKCGCGATREGPALTWLLSVALGLPPSAVAAGGGDLEPWSHAEAGGRWTMSGWGVSGSISAAGC